MIRKALLDDAEKLASLMKQVETESSYMLYGAGERNTTIEKQQKMIEQVNEQVNSSLFVAETDNQLVGYLVAIGGNASKNKHCAYIVIGIISAFQGKGIGTALFEKLEYWALNQNIHRLELTVITENIAGVKLYEKVGFEIEGIKKDSLYMDGKYFDEYYMSRLLEG